MGDITHFLMMSPILQNGPGPVHEAMPYVGLTMFHVVFADVSHMFQFECGEYLGILRGILSVPQNIFMGMNIVNE